MLASLILAIVHASYTLWTLVSYYARRTCTSAPRPLEYPRRQTPKHLALVLVTADGRLREEEEEAYMCKTVVDVVGWCKRAGIETLSVYNRQGVLYKYVEVLREMLNSPSHYETGQQDTECNSESDVEYPLTPPPSDHSISRPLSRNDLRGLSNRVVCISIDSHRPGEGKSGVKRRAQAQRDTFQLKLLSNNASKPLMADVARALAINAGSKAPIIDIETVDNAMQEHDLDAPDYMIIHDIIQQSNASLELDGFPPWLVRLTEIHKTGQDFPKVALPWIKSKQPNGVALTEVDFRRALDEYASAEMRLGK